jgi:hypothetical protein
MAPLVHLRTETDGIGIVANAIANPVKNPDSALDIVRCSTRGRHGKLPDRCGIEVEELGRSKILGRGLRKVL